MLRKLVLFVAAPVAVLAGGLAATTPAFASGVPVNVSVPVSISISGLTTSVSFPATGDGSTATLNPAETYQVASNDGAGYSLTETASNAFFGSPSSPSIIPDANWSIFPTINGTAGPNFSPSTSAVTVYSTTSGPSTDNYTERWMLAIPQTAAEGTYTNTLTYLAVGN